jgi:hypothetical protein
MHYNAVANEVNQLYSAEDGEAASRKQFGVLRPPQRSTENTKGRSVFLCLFVAIAALQIASMSMRTDCYCW